MILQWLFSVSTNEAAAHLNGVAPIFRLVTRPVFRSGFALLFLIEALRYNTAAENTA